MHMPWECCSDTSGDLSPSAVSGSVAAHGLTGMNIWDLPEGMHKGSVSLIFCCCTYLQCTIVGPVSGVLLI